MSDSDRDLAAEHEEGFMSRWSRRKHVARTGTDEELLPAEEVVDEPDDMAVVEEYLPDDSDMPPLESLDDDSDYTGFMSPKVSDELRNLALRKLFLGGMFSSRDGLDDYDDDFTSFEKLGDIITAEMRYQMERVKNAIAENDGTEEALAEEPGDAALESDEAAGEEINASAAAALGNAEDNEAGIEPGIENKNVEDSNVDEDK